MFVRQNQQQFRTANADVQIFYGDGSAPSATNNNRTWNKPPGVSHVYIMCIGGGGTGNGTSAGGGSGAVSVWYGAAQNVPDSLLVRMAPLSGGGAATVVAYRNGGGNPTNLVIANGSSSNLAGGATASGAFLSSGFYQSVSGQDGTTGNQYTASSTFLSGGTDSAGIVFANYGYKNGTVAGQLNGYFQLIPIIVGVGGSGSGQGGIGCGGGMNSGKGGPGMALIASW